MASQSAKGASASVIAAAAASSFGRHVRAHPLRHGLVVLWALGLAGVCGVRPAIAWLIIASIVGLIRSRANQKQMAHPDAPFDLSHISVAVVSATIWAGAPVAAYFSGHPFGHEMAMVLMLSGYFLVFTQFPSAPRLAFIVSSPFTAALLIIVASVWGGPEFWPFIAMLPILLSVPAMHLMVSSQRLAEIRAANEAQARLIEELARTRDEAEAANTAKSHFLATMSHEIRTPLNGVLGMAQAMSKDQLPKLQRQRLDVIVQAGESLLVLLNDILDLSRIEAGRLELEDGRLDVGAMAAGLAAAFEVQAAEKDLYLAVQVSPDASGVWRADPTRVRQILFNLMSNAVKFTETGHVILTIGRDDQGLILEVRDSGPGIASDRLGLLFHKFVQEDASTTRRYGGSGLGLSICRDLAQLMGGSIVAESKVGKGSRFIVRLPLQPIAASAADAAAAPAAEATIADGGTLRILAAEDNATNRLVLTTLLAQLGVDVDVVCDGNEAVEAFEAQNWDLILMDVHMPNLDGMAATRKIRQIEAARGMTRTPIIALTANAMAHHRAEYASCGMDSMVSKPVKLAELIAGIQIALAGVEERPAEAVA